MLLATEIKKAFKSDVEKAVLKAISKIKKLPIRTEKQLNTANDVLGFISSSVESVLSRSTSKQLDEVERKFDDRYDMLL